MHACAQGPQLRMWGLGALRCYPRLAAVRSSGPEDDEPDDGVGWREGGSLVSPMILDEYGPLSVGAIVILLT